MTAYALVTRRMLLQDMGKAGLAVMVLGCAACSADPTSNATPTEEPDTTPAPQDPTTEAGPSTSSPSADTSSTTSDTGHGWQRVDLGFVSAYILYRAGEAALVDTGVGGSEDEIEAALAEIGLGWDSVGHLIITHRHPDHQGSLEAAVTASRAPWYAGAGDLEAINASTAGTAVGDGDSIFDLQIIETPGHTAGHVSVLDPMSGVLVAGDALNGADGGVVGANPDFSDDMGVANASVVKLAGFDYEVVLFGHGEPVVAGASEMVAELADSLDG